MNISRLMARPKEMMNAIQPPRKRRHRNEACVHAFTRSLRPSAFTTEFED
jgi:hypothetical protein